MMILGYQRGKVGGERDWELGIDICTVCVPSRCSRVQLSETPWTTAHQALLSMGILQARILEGVAMPSSRDPPDPGIEPRSPVLPADSLLSEPPGRSYTLYYI